ncbi:hypothetical protein KVF89_19485 [Nocardioides carbamazepini]|uniref:hypothetical protein n=1 Tax=Nocardioides carbamazepini TaxID=2854259 RepID=UPI00214A7F0A|nr:hypothetical protein [Nocardioides carbamazepini]MCR1784735.1 hypothetical protein [Nocardioides carbamazepini]
MSRRSRVMGIAVVVLVTTALAAVAQASPSSTTTPTAKVDCVVYDDAAARCTVVGVVYAIAQIGDTTYLGGAFTAVNGVPRANLAAVRADGSLDPSWAPTTDGIVYALAASADGSKVYVGGGFATINGQPRRLAAVTADTGALVAGWTTTTSNNTVRALAADGTGRLYVGGSFSRVGGRAIARLAALDQTTGAVDPAFAPQPNNTVRALGTTDDGSRLYAGGSFSTMGGQPRAGAAELTPAGATTAFAPTEGGVAISLDVAPTGRLYFGTTNNRTWAYDPAVSSLPLYRVRTSGDVQAILATADEVYVGGHFSGFPESKLNRLHIGSFLAADGTPTAWDPGANGSYGVWAFGLTRTAPVPGTVDALSVGGDFTRVAGAARRGYARFAF